MYIFLSDHLYIFFPYLYFFFNDTATTEIYTLSLHDALPICSWRRTPGSASPNLCGIGPASTFKRLAPSAGTWLTRSEEHTSELQSLRHLVCRLLLEKKKKRQKKPKHYKKHQLLVHTTVTCK